MAVTYASRRETSVTASSASWTPAAPAGVVAGDILLAFFFPTSSSRYVTSFPGWSAIPGAADSRAFWRVATGGPASDFPTATLSGAATGYVSVLRLTSSLGGVAVVANQLTAYSNADQELSVAVSAPAVGTLIGVAYSQGNPGFSSPSGANTHVVSRSSSPMCAVYRRTTPTASEAFGWTSTIGYVSCVTTAIIVYEAVTTNAFFFGGEL